MILECDIECPISPLRCWDIVLTEKEGGVFLEGSVINSRGAYFTYQNFNAVNAYLLLHNNISLKQMISKAKISVIVFVALIIALIAWCF